MDLLLFLLMVYWLAGSFRKTIQQPTPEVDEFDDDYVDGFVDMKDVDMTNVVELDDYRHGQRKVS